MIAPSQTAVAPRVSFPRSVRCVRAAGVLLALDDQSRVIGLVEPAGGGYRIEVRGAVVYVPAADLQVA